MLNENNHHIVTQRHCAAEIPVSYTQRWANRLVAVVGVDTLGGILDDYTAMTSDPELSKDDQNIANIRANNLLLASVTSLLTTDDRNVTIEGKGYADPNFGGISDGW